ncbi:MAG: RNA polymerase sigma-I factor [Bacillaceae bacterium]|nr:RNA polymerase sigma-I factor [Bacillaceae bacterium]
MGKHQAQQEKSKIHDIVKRIQEGDEELRNWFLQKYQPFISQVTSKVCKRYIDPAHDDEFSIALVAFDEALHQYRPGKGSSFLSFADLVIRRRVIDYIRKESRQRKQAFSLDETVEEEGRKENYFEVEASLKQFSLDQESAMRKEEIAHYEERLKDFGISLQELPHYTPKHVDARENAVRIAGVIAENNKIRDHLLQKKKIPMKDLMPHIDMSRKTVERNRIYIIAMAIIMIEDYQYLKSYLGMDKRTQRGGVPHDKEGDRDQIRKKMGYRVNA